jgi:hypothetical protein
VHGTEALLAEPSVPSRPADDLDVGLAGGVHNSKYPRPVADLAHFGMDEQRADQQRAAVLLRSHKAGGVLVHIPLMRHSPRQGSTRQRPPLPARLQTVSKPCGDWPTKSRRPLTTTAFRKLLEATDCAVRALLFKAT